MWLIQRIDAGGGDLHCFQVVPSKKDPQPVAYKLGFFLGGGVQGIKPNEDTRDHAERRSFQKLGFKKKTKN